MTPPSAGPRVYAPTTQPTRRRVRKAEPTDGQAVCRSTPGPGRDLVHGRQHLGRLLRLALLQAAHGRPAVGAKPRVADPRMDLESVLGAEFLQPILAAK